MFWGSHSGGGAADNVCYADLRVTAVVFANEWDKRILLTSLENVRKLFNVRVYAFCVLDDRLRLMLGGTAGMRLTTVRVLLSTLIERYVSAAEKIGEYDVMPDSAVAEACILSIEDEQDAMQVMRYIHLTPSAEGYALGAVDYWWSSYNTYRGRYCWQIVDTGGIMKTMERQNRQMAKDLMEYHRRAETLRNPAPSCIRDGVFRRLDWKRYYIPAGITDEKINETFGA